MQNGNIPTGFYWVTNDSLAFDINEFTIFFDYGLYENLGVTTPLVDWDELTVDPILIFGVPDDGFYDALANVIGIAPGSTATGFSVSFDWLGTGTPGSQYFDVVDPQTFVSLDSGNTSNSGNIPIVPEPGSLLLVGWGLIGFAGLYRRRKRKGMK